MNVVTGLLDKHPQLGVMFSYCLSYISCSLRQKQTLCPNPTEQDVLILVPVTTQFLIFYFIFFIYLFI